MANVGLSFSPTQAQGQQQQQTNAPTIQDAIKILSFRLPSVVGANAPASQAILGGANSGTGTQFDTALIQNWLKSLFSGAAPGQTSSPNLPAQPQPMSGSPFANPQPTPAPPPPMNTAPMPSVQFHAANDRMTGAPMPAGPQAPMGGMGGFGAMNRV